jgi:hypothetical protein
MRARKRKSNPRHKKNEEAVRKAKNRRSPRSPPVLRLSRDPEKRMRSRFTVAEEGEGEGEARGG